MQTHPDNECLLGSFLRRYDSASTPDAYSRDVGEFLRFLGQRPLTDITASDLEAYRSFLAFARWRRSGQEGHYSQTTQDRKIDAVRSFLRWAMEQGHCHIPEVQFRVATRWVNWRRGRG